jgi:hypothetical protein
MKSGMMKKLFLIAIFALPLTSCGVIKITPKKTEKPTETVNKPVENVKANFDVDLAASDKFKLDLTAEFPIGTNSETIEKALSSRGFDCGPDPLVPTERACTNAQTQDKCVIMSIVRTNPLAIDKAQIIKACNVVN